MNTLLSRVRRRGTEIVRRIIDRISQRTKRYLRDAPYGEQLVAMVMKRRLRSGRAPGLSTPEEVGAYFDRAIADLTADGADHLRYFEAGVYAGGSLAEWFRRCEAAGVQTTMFGADSFAGLPDSTSEDEGSWFPGEFYCPIEVTEWNIRRLGVPDEDVTLIKGWFDETLTSELAAEIGSVEVAMLDADTYLSTVPVLEFLEPLLADRAWLIFDDWYSGGNLDVETGGTLGIGVERAFAEWQKGTASKWQVEEIGDYDFEYEKGRRRPAGRVLRLDATTG